MLIIPYEQLSGAALRGLLEEFVTRDGTDYGVQEVSTESKLEQAMAQLRRGDVVIVFDEDSETTALVSREDVASLDDGFLSTQE